MRIVPEVDIPQTVTIINKLKKADALTNTDVWYKHTLYNCVWQVQSNAQQVGTTTNLGASNKVQIPSNQTYTYLPYKEWKNAGNQDNHFTVSQNDWIVLGEVTEDITSNNITQIMSQYEPNACKIQLFEDLTLPNYKSNGFLEQYASIYYVEGV